MSVAVITGASSGLGKEYIDALIEHYPLVDEFWIIARRKDALKELAKKYTAKTVVPMALDLLNDESFDIFDRILREMSPEIKVLINAAGYGQCADFFSADKMKQTGMVDLNCRALTWMTRLCLPYMADESLIVNIASIAGFLPLPRMAVYAASKSYVLDFSKALREELRPRGINVLAVCPGPMDTEFFDVAYTPEGSSKLLDSLPRLNPKDVTAGSLRYGKRKRAVYVPGALYKVYHVLAKIIPHNWLIKFMEV